MTYQNWGRTSKLGSVWFGEGFFDPVTALHRHRNGLHPPNTGLGLIGWHWCRDGVVSVDNIWLTPTLNTMKRKIGRAHV